MQQMSLWEEAPARHSASPDSGRLWTILAASSCSSISELINPSHYKDGPFECIELSRLLSSDWGQAVQYCFRWQHKNGVEDLKKAIWFINDAITHNVPFFAACCKRNADILEAQAIRLLSILQAENWADLEQFWRNLKWGDRVDVLEALTDKINEIEKEGK